MENQKETREDISIEVKENVENEKSEAVEQIDPETIVEGNQEVTTDERITNLEARWEQREEELKRTASGYQQLSESRGNEIKELKKQNVVPEEIVEIEKKVIALEEKRREGTHTEDDILNLVELKADLRSAKRLEAKMRPLYERYEKERETKKKNILHDFFSDNEYLKDNDRFKEYLDSFKAEDSGDITRGLNEALKRAKILYDYDVSKGTVKPAIQKPDPHNSLGGGGGGTSSSQIAVGGQTRLTPDQIEIMKRNGIYEGEKFMKLGRKSFVKK